MPSGRTGWKKPDELYASAQRQPDAPGSKKAYGRRELLHASTHASTPAPTPLVPIASEGCCAARSGAKQPNKVGLAIVFGGARRL